MDVEIQSASEALDDRHRARSPVADAIAARAVPLHAQQEIANLEEGVSQAAGL
jgi:hypothetical protein